ncbi:hypothetical protein AC249_AIPGENE4675 [Exaiptasia diaphana]|nr:hypothetical protein AC249_AIPGENE4675 [Exaiptasia diaphana]
MHAEMLHYTCFSQMYPHSGSGHRVVFAVAPMCCSPKAVFFVTFPSRTVVWFCRSSLVQHKKLAQILS